MNRREVEPLQVTGYTRGPTRWTGAIAIDPVEDAPMVIYVTTIGDRRVRVTKWILTNTAAKTHY